MPTLVLGAETPLGNALVATLAQRGVAVRAFVDEARREAAPGLRERGIPVAIGDPQEVDFVAATAEGADTVIVLSEPYAAADDTRLARTGARLAQRRSITRVIYLSTIDADTGSPHPYLADRGRAEKLLRDAADEKIVVARANVVVGTVLQACWRTRLPVVPGTGRQVWHPVRPDDVVEALCDLDDVANPERVRYVEGAAVAADAVVAEVAPRPHLLRHDRDGTRFLPDRLGTHLTRDIMAAGSASTR